MQHTGRWLESQWLGTGRRLRSLHLTQFSHHTGHAKEARSLRDVEPDGCVLWSTCRVPFVPYLAWRWLKLQDEDRRTDILSRIQPEKSEDIWPRELAKLPFCVPWTCSTICMTLSSSYKRYFTYHTPRPGRDGAELGLLRGPSFSVSWTR